MEYAQFTYNTTPYIAMSFTPYELVFEKKQFLILIFFFQEKLPLFNSIIHFHKKPNADDSRIKFVGFKREK